MPTSSSAAQPNLGRAAAALAAQKRALAEALIEAAGPTEAEGGAFRRAARRRFLGMGAPVKRDEYWKFTDPARLTDPMAPAPEADAGSATERPFGAVDALKLVFVNGRFRPDLSDRLALEGVEILPLSQALAGESWLDGRIGSLESLGQTPVERPLAALNGARAIDGAAIRVMGRAPKPIHLCAETTGEGDGYLRHWIELAPGAELTLLESGAAGRRHNATIEAQIAEAATLHHLRRQDGAAALAATALFAALGQHATLKSFTLSAADGAGLGLARNEAVVWLDGDDASAHLAGGVLAADDAHVDNTVFLTHGGLNGESRQVYKNVLADQSAGVFQGKILVKSGAQKTDGYQISQSLLLDERASFSAKPELEIYADDVKCSHGSTSGAVDEESMFYLRSRGVPERAAQAMLVGAFIEEAIVEIADPALRETVREQVSQWMSARIG